MAIFLNFDRDQMKSIFFLLLGVSSITTAERYPVEVNFTSQSGQKSHFTFKTKADSYDEVKCYQEKLVLALSQNDDQSWVTSKEVSQFEDESFLEFFTPLVGEQLKQRNLNEAGVASVELKFFQDKSNRVAYDEARSLIEEGQHQDALKKLKSIEMPDKILPCVLYHTGKALSSLEKYQQSIPYYDQAIAAAPDNSRLYYSRGFRYKKLGEYQQALNDTYKTLAGGDEFWETYHQLSDIYDLMDDHVNAIKYASLGLKYRDDDYFYGDRGWVYLDNGNLQMAKLDFQKALETNPEKASHLSGMAEVLNQLGAHQESLGLVTKAIENEGETHFRLQTKADVLIEMGREEEAVKVFHKAMEYPGDVSNSYNNLGWMYQKNNQLELAIETYKQGLEKFPDDLYLLNNVAMSLYLNGSYDDSMTHAKYCISIQDESKTALEHWLLGANLMATNQLDKSFQHLRKAFVIDENFGDGYYQFVHKKSEGNFLKETLSQLVSLSKESNDAVYVKATLLLKKLDGK